MRCWFICAKYWVEAKSMGAWKAGSEAGGVLVGNTLKSAVHDMQLFCTKGLLGEIDG